MLDNDPEILALRQLVRAQTPQFNEEADLDAITGDENGVLEVRNAAQVIIPGKINVSLSDPNDPTKGVRRVLAVWGSASEAGATVKIRQDAAGEWYIVRGDVRQTSYTHGESAVAALQPPASAQGLSGRVETPGYRMLPGRVTRSLLGGMYVYVGEFSHAGGWFGGDDEPIAAPTNSSKETVTIVSIDRDANAVALTVSDELPSGTLETPEDIKAFAATVETPIGYSRRGAVRSRTGQVELTDDDIVDIRRWADGAAGGAPVEVAVVDYPTNRVDTDAALLRTDGVPSSTDACTGGTASASTELTGGLFPASLAFDDDDNTFWHNDGDGNGAWIEYEFSGPVSIIAYSLLPTNRGFNESRMPTAWKLQAFVSSSWTDVDTRTGVSWSDDVTEAARTYEINGPPQTSDEWRILVTTVPSGDFIEIAEIAMFEGSGYYRRLAQQFQVPVSQPVNKVQLWLKRVGSPTDNLTAAIHEDSAGEPGALVATSAAVGMATVGTAYAQVAFVFDPAVSLYSRKDYWLVLAGEDNDSGSAYLTAGSDREGDETSLGEVDTAGNWMPRAGTLAFKVSMDFSL